MTTTTMNSFLVVVYLDTGSCSMTRLWGADVPTSVRDCSKTRLHRNVQRLILKTRPTVLPFSGSVSFTLRVLTPPPTRHPEIEPHRSSHPFSHPRSGLGPSAQTIFNPTGLQRKSWIFCLINLNLLPRSLLTPVTPCQDTVYAVSSPVRSPPFRWHRRC